MFEKKREDKLLLDDTKPLFCNIKEAQNTDGHIVSFFVCMFHGLEGLCIAKCESESSLIAIVLEGVCSL